MGKILPFIPQNHSSMPLQTGKSDLLHSKKFLVPVALAMSESGASTSPHILITINRGLTGSFLLKLKSIGTLTRLHFQLLRIGFSIKEPQNMSKDEDVNNHLQSKHVLQQTQTERFLSKSSLSRLIGVDIFHGTDNQLPKVALIFYHHHLCKSFLM